MLRLLLDCYCSRVCEALFSPNVEETSQVLQEYTKYIDSDIVYEPVGPSEFKRLWPVTLLRARRTLRVDPT